VCFLLRGGRVLLQERAAGRLWAGRLNGPGGKLAARERPEAGVAREVLEETGVRVKAPRSAGRIDLVFDAPAPFSILRVHVFTSERFSGTVTGNAEGRLRWFSVARLPWDRLWPDQRYWLPAVLDGGAVSGVCRFDAAGARLIECRLGVRWSSRHQKL